MIRSRAAAALLAVGVIAAGCGSETAETSVASSPTTAPVTTSTTTTTPPAETTAAAAAAPSILALSSGRGDDGSLEVVVWLASDPLQDQDHRIVIGTDADESYPGVGDPLPHLDGRLEITAERAALYDGSEEVASGDALGEEATWGMAGGALRVFFIGTVPTRAGTLWVFVEATGAPVAAGVAGAPVGEQCSHHGAGVDVPESDVPDAGTPCRYPLG